MSDPVYLGDGLYVRFANLQIILLANDPHDPTDQVCIEWPDVWQRLQTFVNARAKYGSPEALRAAEPQEHEACEECSSKRAAA